MLTMGLLLSIFCFNCTTPLQSCFNIREIGGAIVVTKCVCECVSVRKSQGVLGCCGCWVLEGCRVLAEGVDNGMTGDHTLHI